MNPIKRLDNYPLHESFRGYFGRELYELMASDPNIYIITAGLGYKLFDPHREDFTDRFIDTGAAEMSAVSIAVGIAMQNKIPVVYSITPFLLRRPYELLKLYVNDEKLPVKLVGSGRNDDYIHDGASHWANDAATLLDGLPNIKQYWPESKEDVPDIVDEFIYNNRPSFISLRK